MSKTLILGDPHLGGSLSIGKPGIGSSLNSRVVDQLNILEWVLSTAIDADADNIIITGDVFDEQRPHPALVSLFISWLKKCSDNDINVHIIMGNHDLIRSGQFYMSALDIISSAEIEGVYVYKHMSTFHTGNAAFTLLPFTDRKSFNTSSNSEALEMLKNKLPYEVAGIENTKIKVLIGHLAIEGSIPIGNEIDDMINELFCPISMFKGYDYVWMGHIHKPQIMNKIPFVAHIGSMDLSNFGEVDQKKYIVSFDPSEEIPYKYIEIPTRQLKQISISVPEDISDTTNYVLNEIKSKFSNLSKSIVKVNVSLGNSDAISIDRSAIEKHLNEINVFYISRISEERKISLIKTKAAGIDDTINETTAIKMFSETNIEENLRDKFISLANEIVKEVSPE